MKGDKPLFEPVPVTDNNYEVISSQTMSNLSVREHVAVEAMKGLLSNPQIINIEYFKLKEKEKSILHEEFAITANKFADALIAQSEVKE